MTTIQIDISQGNLTCYFNSKDGKGHKIKKGDTVVYIEEFGEWDSLFCKEHAIKYLHAVKNKMYVFINQIKKFDTHHERNTIGNNRK